MYDSHLTRSVIDRLAGLTFVVRAVLALTFGFSGALLGAFFSLTVGAAVSSNGGGDPRSLWPLGFILGGGMGGALGLGFAHLLVVGIEWAQQVLGALHVLAVGQTGAAPEQAPGAQSEEAELQTAVSARPNDAAAHAGLGTFYRLQGRYVQSGQAYARALAIDPTSASILNNIGNLKRVQGDLAGAEEAYLKALRIDPQAVVPQFNLSLVRMDQRRIPEAIAELQKVLQLDPGHQQAKELIERLQRL